MKVCGHYTEDLSAYAFEFDGTSDDRGIASEALFPEAVAQNDISVITRRIFASVEGSPKFRLSSQNREQLSRHCRPREADRFAEASEIEFVALRISADFHGVDLLSHRDEGALGISPSHADQFTRILVAQRDQQDSVHQAEDGSVRSNAERQSDNRHRGKSRALAQLAKCESKILEDSSHRSVFLFTRSAAPPWDRPW